MLFVNMPVLATNPCSCAVSPQCASGRVTMVRLFSSFFNFLSLFTHCRIGKMNIIFLNYPPSLIKYRICNGKKNPQSKSQSQSPSPPNPSHYPFPSFKTPQYLDKCQGNGNLQIEINGHKQGWQQKGRHEEGEQRVGSEKEGESMRANMNTNEGG